MADSFLKDALGRTTKVTDRNGDETTYAYDAVSGQLVAIGYANGTRTEIGYDLLDRTSVTHLKGSDVLARFTYTLGDTGRRERVDEVIDGIASTVEAA